MKNVLITSFDMEVGGVERSLLGMLNNFDHQQFDLALFLYRQSGDFLDLLPPQVKLLDEIKEYKTVRLSIKQIFKQKMWILGFARLMAKMSILVNKNEESGYLQTQLIWKYCLPFFPNRKKEYDVAISYLWPHHYVAKKVQAKVKIAWIHTDYSAIETDIESDLLIWRDYDHIVSISDDCSKAFIKKYPSLQNKLIVIENITAPEFIKEMSIVKFDNIFIKKHFNLLTVGRLCHPKAIDNAIKALHLIHQKGFKDIKWFAIGDGPDKSFLEDLIKKYDLTESFILLGKINNPYPYIKQCDLYLQPSRYEGKSVAVTEAKILAKPILITNYPTAKSQVSQNIDGIICDNSIEEIANNIIDLYKNPNKLDLLSRHCSKENYGNKDELNKLYSIINNNI